MCQLSNGGRNRDGRGFTYGSKAPSVAASCSSCSPGVGWQLAGGKAHSDKNAIEDDSLGIMAVAGRMGIESGDELEQRAKVDVKPKR